MSRIGKKPIDIPAGVTVVSDGRQLAVKGPKGELVMECRREVSVEVEDKTVVVKQLGEVSDRVARAFHGMTRALVQNMVTGVSTGYERKLEINGVGYNAQTQGTDLVLHLGFSHPVNFPVPSSVTVEVPSPTSVIVRGCDKQQVGQVAAAIRSLRPPEPYKGKGVKYSDESIHRKQGKAFGSA